MVLLASDVATPSQVSRGLTTATMPQFSTPKTATTRATTAAAMPQAPLGANSATARATTAATMPQAPLGAKAATARATTAATMPQAPLGANAATHVQKRSYTLAGSALRNLQANAGTWSRTRRCPCRSRRRVACSRSSPRMAQDGWSGAPLCRCNVAYRYATRSRQISPATNRLHTSPATSLATRWFSEPPCG